MKQAALAPLFAVPFAAQAQTNTITQIPQTATSTGRASMALGFPASCMTPLAAGGNPPYGQDLNGILNMLSTAAQAAELGMMRPFSASYAEAVGGYPAGATVAHPTITGRYLLCTQDGNENDPAVSMAGWTDPMTAFQPAGNYALAADLTAETQRAEAAEANLTPYSAFTQITGSTVSGDGVSRPWICQKTPDGTMRISGFGYFPQSAGTAGARILLPIAFPAGLSE